MSSWEIARRTDDNPHDDSGIQKRRRSLEGVLLTSRFTARELRAMERAITRAVEAVLLLRARCPELFNPPPSARRQDPSHRVQQAIRSLVDELQVATLAGAAHELHHVQARMARAAVRQPAGGKKR